MTHLYSPEFPPWSNNTMKNGGGGKKRFSIAQQTVLLGWFGGTKSYYVAQTTLGLTIFGDTFYNTVIGT